MANRMLMFVMSILVPQTLDAIANDLYTIELQIPKFLRGMVKNLLDSNKLMRSSTINLDWDDTRDSDNFLARITTKGFPNIKSRRGLMQRQPGVEIGPGAFKTEIVTYPPNLLANRLKYLLKLKEKQAKQTPLQ